MTRSCTAQPSSLLAQSQCRGLPPWAEFVHLLEGTLADGLRAGLATATAELARADRGPAILVFDASGKLQYATDAARQRVGLAARDTVIVMSPTPDGSPPPPLCR